MPRKEPARVPGVWEKVPGSGTWSIRYRVDGKLKREKVGPRGDAIALYQQRKSQTRAGAKLPDNMRTSGVKFKELAEAILTYSATHHRDTRNVKSRLSKVLLTFGERAANKVKPQDIDSWLTANTKTPATSNRYRALFGLIYREALRNGKVTSNPARLVRQRHEDNAVIRWLTGKEETGLRAAIAEHYPEHLPELVIGLGTGMRLAEQFGLLWESVDFKRKEIRLRTTKNYSGRSIPMNAEVLSAFEKLRDSAGKESDRVFLRDHDSFAHEQSCRVPADRPQFSVPGQVPKRLQEESELVGDAEKHCPSRTICVSLPNGPVLSSFSGSMSFEADIAICLQRSGLGRGRRPSGPQSSAAYFWSRP
jgi:hypothetical protein